jgi:hypothetical protein
VATAPAIGGSVVNLTDSLARLVRCLLGSSYIPRAASDDHGQRRPQLLDGRDAAVCRLAARCVPILRRSAVPVSQGKRPHKDRDPCRRQRVTRGRAVVLLQASQSDTVKRPATGFRSHTAERKCSLVVALRTSWGTRPSCRSASPRNGCGSPAQGRRTPPPPTPRGVRFLHADAV